MINPNTCRAARGLINWSQQQLANAANIGVSTVKNFENGKTRPTANNLLSINGALEKAGVIVLSEDQGGPGILYRCLKLRAYIPGEGINLEVNYSDLFLDAPDNNFNLWFKIDDAALAMFADRSIVDEADARSVAEKYNARLINIVKQVITRDGLSSPGGGARMITAEDIMSFQ